MSGQWRHRCSIKITFASTWNTRQDGFHCNLWWCKWCGFRGRKVSKKLWFKGRSSYSSLSPQKSLRTTLNASTIIRSHSYDKTSSFSPQQTLRVPFEKASAGFRWQTQVLLNFFHLHLRTEGCPDSHPHNKWNIILPYDLPISSLYRCNTNFSSLPGRVFNSDLSWYNSLYDDGSVEEIKLLLKRLCLSTALFSNSSELLLGDTVTGSVTPRFTERPPFFNVTIPTWTLTSFSTLSGSFSAFLLEMAWNTLNDRLPSSIRTQWRLRVALMLSPTSSVWHSENHSPYPYSSLSFFQIYGKRLQQSHTFSPQNEQNIIAKSWTSMSSFPAKHEWAGGCKARSHGSDQVLITHSARTELFIFNLHRYVFFLLLWFLAP